MLLPALGEFSDTRDDVREITRDRGRCGCCSDVCGVCCAMRHSYVLYIDGVYTHSYIHASAHAPSDPWKLKACKRARVLRRCGVFASTPIRCVPYRFWTSWNQRTRPATTRRGAAQSCECVSVFVCLWVLSYIPIVCSVSAIWRLLASAVCALSAYFGAMNRNATNSGLSEIAVPQIAYSYVYVFSRNWIEAVRWNGTGQFNYTLEMDVYRVASTTWQTMAWFDYARRRHFAPSPSILRSIQINQNMRCGAVHWSGGSKGQTHAHAAIVVVVWRERLGGLISKSIRSPGSNLTDFLKMFQ